MRGTLLRHPTNFERSDLKRETSLESFCHCRAVSVANVSKVIFAVMIKQAGQFLTLHADDVFRLEEIPHDVGWVGVYAAMPRFHHVPPRQTNPPSLGLVLEFVGRAKIETSSNDTLQIPGIQYSFSLLSIAVTEQSALVYIITVANDIGSDATQPRMTEITQEGCPQPPLEIATSKHNVCSGSATQFSHFLRYHML